MRSLTGDSPPPGWYEPPEPPPECRDCGGDGSWWGPLKDYPDARMAYVCERCDGTGIEPERDPYEDSRIP